MTRLKIFVSYSHRDPEYLGRDSLLGFLRGLEADENVEFWTDERLEGGTYWDDQIRDSLGTCDIALVLVSQSFLDSPYCTSIELTTFLDRCRKDGMIVFPVILSPCEWERHEWLTCRQFIPSGGETIEEHYSEPGKRKRLFLKIRQELRSAIARAREAREQRKAAATPAPRAAVERRQITAIRCDLVPRELGGDPISGEDLPEILHELTPDFQQVCRAEFERFEGSIAQTLGSGVVACFGHPIVHEDDSRRAVRAGLSLIEKVAKLSERFEQELSVRLAVRIGVHTGVVIAETSGELATESEVTVTAARVQELAPLNGVAVSDATHELIAQYFETESLGLAMLPSRQTVEAHRIVRDTGHHSRLYATGGRGLTKLVGRDKEIDLLLDRWQETRRGNGQVVMLRAEAGIGKSRLLAEVKSRVESEPHHWIECRCSPYHQNTAFHPVIASLETTIGIDGNDSDVEKLAKLEAALQKFGSGIEEILPPLAALLSIPYEHRYAKLTLGPREQKELMLQAMVQLVVEDAKEKPVMVILEDLHWVDPSTTEFIDLLIEQAANERILVLCAFRPEFAAPANWMSCSYVSQISLDRLGRDEAEQMILHATGGKRLPAVVLEEIFRKTEGFPLFIEDLTRMVLESDLVVEREDRYELAGPFQSLAIPATLNETLMARLARLATAKPVAQLGAAIGREFVFEMLRAVGEFDDKTLTEELNKLVQAGLLYKRGLLSRAKYVFKHALVQEALHQSLVKKQRRQYHKMIADVLEEKFRDVAETQPELLAHHYNEAGAVAKAVDYWQRAADRALAGSANVEAVSHARHAIEALATLPDDASRNEKELRLRMVEGPAILALRGWASHEVAACYTRMRELCHGMPKNEQVFKSLRGTWTNHMVAARLEESLVYAEEMHAMAVGSDDVDLLLEAHAALCDTLFWMGRPPDANENVRIGFELWDFDQHHASHARDFTEDPATMYFTYGALSLYLMGDVRESFLMTEAAIAMFERFSHLHSRAFLIWGVAQNFLQARDAVNVERYAQQLIDLSTANQFGAWLPIGRALKGWAIASMGDLDAGLAEIIEGRRQWHAIGAGVKACLYPAIIADLLCRAGRTSEAQEWVQTGLDAAAKCDDRYYYSELYRVQGDALVKTDAPESEAIDAYETARRIAREQGARMLELRAATGLASLHVARERHEEAAAILEPLRSLYAGETLTVDGAEAAAVASLVMTTIPRR